jgi:uridine kinase
MPEHNEHTLVKPSAARSDAQVWLPDNQILGAPVGTPLETYLRAAGLIEEQLVVAGVINGEMRELHYRVTGDSEVDLVTMHSSDGMRVYRRSLSLLLVTAAHELFPDAQVYVDHSLTFGGYFCTVEGRSNFSEEELEQIGRRMREIVDRDDPITKERYLLNEAIDHFYGRGDLGKVRLLSQRRKDYLVLYRLRDMRDYFHGYMVPSTRYLRWFELKHYPPGFIIRFPRSSAPTTLLPFQDYPRLAAVFREYRQWLSLMDVLDVGSLNECIRSGRIQEVVLVAEALHEGRIAQIAREIVRRSGIKLVLIAGPSSSGKTTFSKRLSIQLLASGVRPHTIAMDNYFVDRSRTPRDESGDYDFEVLEALDLELFNQHLLQLMDGQVVTLPRFNFISGRRESGDSVKLYHDHIILAEGIHGLNPALVPDIPPSKIYRIYISALTQLNLDQHNRVPTTDTRLIRRIVRDATHRGYSASETLARWRSVRRGEKKHIFPYQEHADVMFNSALVYDLAALKPLAEPLLLQVEPGTVERIEAKRLLAMLQWFEACPVGMIPDNSILREFVGGSILRDFEPGDSKI